MLLMLHSMLACTRQAHIPAIASLHVECLTLHPAAGIWMSYTGNGHVSARIQEPLHIIWYAAITGRTSRVLF